MTTRHWVVLAALVTVLGLLALPAAAQQTNLLGLGEGPSWCRAGVVWRLAVVTSSTTRPQRVGVSGGQDHRQRLRGRAAVPVDARRLRDGHGRGSTPTGRGPRTSWSRSRPRRRRPGSSRCCGLALQDKADNQRFAAQAPGRGAVRAADHPQHHGDEGWTELIGFSRLRHARPVRDVGRHLRHLRHRLLQVPPAQAGHGPGGLLRVQRGGVRGSVEGRVMKLTWVEGRPASGGVRVRAGRQELPGRLVARHRQGQRRVRRLERDAGELGGRGVPALVRVGLGRAPEGPRRRRPGALYGILFDTDKATIRPESLPTLDEVVGCSARSRSGGSPSRATRTRRAPRSTTGRSRTACRVGQGVPGVQGRRDRSPRHRGLRRRQAGGRQCHGAGSGTEPPRRARAPVGRARMTLSAGM